MEFIVKPKVLPGQKCIAQNYKSKYKPWENGTVRDVSADLKADGSHRLSYTVILERKGPANRLAKDGSILFLYVGNSGIEPRT
jgi:hypothetical protein